MNHWLQQFWQRPQGTFVRRALFQIHLWVGIGVGLYILLISLSGAALVFREELEPVLHSNERTLTPGAQRLSFDTLRQNIEAKFSGYHVTWMIEPEQSHQAMEVWFEKDKDERIALVNPYDGSLIREVNRQRTLFGFLQDLHFYLLAGDAGGAANGIGAILLFSLCLTGLIIWWPGIKNWTRGLKIKRGTGWKRFNWDTHNAVGFWTLLFVTIWGVTGTYFVFPEPFRATVNFFAPLTPRAVEEKPQPAPAEAKLADVDTLIARAVAVTPGQQTTWIGLPQRDGAPARIYRKQPGAHEETWIELHPVTAAVLKVHSPQTRTTGDTIICWFGWLHFGTFAGGWSKAFWVVLGLAPALLFITGFFMWWNRVVSKKLRARRRVTAALEAQSN
jgi:uncharacterized iron-regulated membrane protein